jgi:mono/diheme cytochrome c family protein
LQALRFCLLPALLAAPAAFAADADSGKRLAEVRCATCHVVSPAPGSAISNAPPFDVIARASNPDILAFVILDPHPRMSVMLTRPEAQDIAAYILTLVR